MLDDDANVTSSKGGVKEVMTGKELKERMKEKYGTDKVTYINNEPDFSVFTDPVLGGVTVDEIPSTRDGKGGTFDIATTAVAERLGWTKAQVTEYMEKNRLTWHETADRRHILPVPTVINATFKHTGGISKQEGMEAIRDKWAEWFGGSKLKLVRHVGGSTFRVVSIKSEGYLKKVYSAQKKANHNTPRAELLARRRNQKGVLRGIVKSIK